MDLIDDLSEAGLRSDAHDDGHRLGVWADGPGEIRDGAPVGHRRQQQLLGAEDPCEQRRPGGLDHQARVCPEGVRDGGDGVQGRRERDLDETRHPRGSGGEREGRNGRGGGDDLRPELAATDGFGVVSRDQLGAPLGVVGVLEGLLFAGRPAGDRRVFAGQRAGNRRCDLNQGLDVRGGGERGQDEQVASVGLGPAGHSQRGPCVGRGQRVGLRAQEIGDVAVARRQRDPSRRQPCVNDLTHGDAGARRRRKGAPQDLVRADQRVEGGVERALITVDDDRALARERSGRAEEDPCCGDSRKVEPGLAVGVVVIR